MWKCIAYSTLTLVLALGAMAESDPVATLQSSDSLEEKAEACRLLSISGGVEAIPVLEPLLTDEILSHMARYALEVIPGDEADAALRRALKTTSELLLAGVITSLGVRRDDAATSEIIPLLADENHFVAEAAARALGRIAAPEGVKALEQAIAQPDLDYSMMQALSDGLFAAAEHALANNQPHVAAVRYDNVYAIEGLSDTVRAAALRGAVLARQPKGGRSLIADAIAGDNPVFFVAALRIALETEDKHQTAKEIATLLPTVAPERRIQLIQLLGELGQAVAGPVLLKEALAGETPVRVAALNAAVRLSHAPVVALLTELVLSEDVALAKAARDGLSFFPGPEGDAAVKDLLASNDAQLRRVAVELIGQGALPEPEDLLMQTARNDADESVRVAALKSVREYVGMPQMSGLLDHLLQARSADEMLAAEQGLVLLCMRQKEAGNEAPEELTDALCKALTASDEPTRLAIVRVLTSTGSQKALDPVLRLALEGEGELKDASVRAVCDWPTLLALPTLIGWVDAPPSDTTRVLALRGAVRLLMLGQEAPEVLSQHYAALLAKAASADEKKLVLSGLAKVAHASALTVVLEQFDDDAVKAEAVLAAIAIAKNLGDDPESAEALKQAQSLIPEL